MTHICARCGNRPFKMRSRRWRRSCPLSTSFQTLRLRQQMTPKQRTKTKKNTDLWEENYHSGPVEKAGAIFIPLPARPPLIA